MKGGSVAGLPVLCAVSPVCVLASPFSWRGGPVEWREWCAVVPSPRLVLSPPSSQRSLSSNEIRYPRIVQSPLRCILSCRAARFLFVLLCCVRGTGGRRVWCAWSHCERCIPFLPAPLFCVCCHSIVGLGLCLCDRVVSLWNSGDGLC